MSQNALVIKGTNFATNKVATVTFAVPCTGVSFNSSAVTLDALGAATIGYTVAPADATDAVSFASSDSTVVSVNGTTLTAVGIGECTLTITCGEQSDTCTVTVDITETATCAALAAPSVYQGTSWYSLKYDSTSTIIAAQPYAGSGMENKLYTLGTSQITDIVDMAPISIPPNTATIHLSVKKCQNANNQIYFVDPSQSYTPSGSIVSYNLITSIGGISASSNQIDDDIEVPEGAVAFFLKLAPQSATGATSMTSESDLLAALTGAGTNQMNLTIHYLPEAES